MEDWKEILEDEIGLHSRIRIRSSSARSSKLFVLGTHASAVSEGFETFAGSTGVLV